MQLSKREKKIIFRLSDFERMRQILMERHGLTSSDARRQIKTFIQTTTDVVNRRFQYYLKGKRAPERLKYAFEVFRYIWDRGNRSDTDLIFVGVALKEISNDLVQIRRVGRPKKVGAPRKSDEKHDKKYRYEIFENHPIPHGTTLSRILKSLSEAELIKMETDIKLGKKKENTFYRISPACFNDAVTPEEKLEKSLIKIIKDDQQVGKQILAREWILACNGLSIPQKSINNWIKMWDDGDREIVYGYGPIPTPFKINYIDEVFGGWTGPKGQVFSDFVQDFYKLLRTHPGPDKIPQK